MRHRLVAFAASACALFAIPLLAHHSFEAEYDFNKPVKFSGTVTKMEWMNPHVHFYIDVKVNGKVMNWDCELGAISVLLKQGWRKDSLKVGDHVTVEGYLPKDATRAMANVRRVTLADGTKVFGGSSADVAHQ